MNDTVESGPLHSDGVVQRMTVWVVRRIRRAIQRVARLRLKWIILLALVVIITYRSPLLGLVVLGAVGVVGISLGGRTPVAMPIVYILALYLFSARYVLSGPRLAVAVLLALGCALLFVAGRLGREIAATPPPRLNSPFAFSLGAYIVVALTSYAYGMTFALEPAEVARADRSMLLLIALSAVALLVYDSTRSYADVQRILLALLVGASFLAFVACLQAGAGVDLVSSLRLPGFTANTGVADRSLGRLGIERSLGTATHPIEAGTAMAAALPIALHFAAFSLRLAARVASAASGVLLLAGVLVTVSRSALICLALAAVLLLPRWTPGRRLGAVSAGLVAFAAIAIVLPSFTDAAVAIIGDFGGSEIAGADVGARTADYEVVRRIVAERPLLGRGYGTFDPGVHFATDNQVLKSLLEIGVIGLFVLAVFIAATVREAGVARSRSGRAVDRDIALTAQTSFVVIASSMLFFDGMSFGITLGTFFFLAGCCGALGNISRSAENTVASTHLVAVSA